MKELDIHRYEIVQHTDDGIYRVYDYMPENDDGAFVIAAFGSYTKALTFANKNLPTDQLRKALRIV